MGGIIRRSRGTAFGGSSSSSSSLVYKQTRLLGGGNKTLDNTATFTAVDATNLGYLTLTLAIGEVVRCTLNANIWTTSNSEYGGVDFGVDRPVSADTRCYPTCDFGAAEIQSNFRTPYNIVGYFTCAEAGSHGFRPLWRTYDVSHGLVMANAASGDDDVAIVFTVEKLPAPTA